MRKLAKTSTVIITLILAIIACFACKKEKTLQAPPPTIPTTDTARATTGTGLKYLALGDSYTIGQGVPENDRFPAQTVALLTAENFKVQPPVYIATTGWTTANLKNAITAQNPAAIFDIVTLLIGVNDQYQHLDTAGYRMGFTDLLNTAVALAGNRPQRVIVLSIPDYSATPYVHAADKARVSKEIDDFNAINRHVTLSYKISYVDVTAASREATNDASLVATDGLHPSAKQYAKWAVLLAPVIKNVLK
jgi:lysophospholipase L1-like esterase